MKKKSKMDSEREPMAPIHFETNVDSLVDIFEYSRVKERRNLSCVSSIFREAFDKSREKCTNVAMRKLVGDRDESVYFPIIFSMDDPLSDGLPDKFDKKKLKRYFDYQVDAAYTRYYRYGMTTSTFREALETDYETMKIFCKAAVLFFHGCGCTCSKATIMDYFEGITIDDESIDMVISSMDEGYDISQLFPYLVNIRGNNFLDTFIANTWRDRIGHLPM